MTIANEFFDNIDRQIENELNENWIRIERDQLPDRMQNYFPFGSLFISKDEKFIAVPRVNMNLFENLCSVDSDSLLHIRDYNKYVIYNEFSDPDQNIRDIIQQIIDRLYEEL